MSTTAMDILTLLMGRGDRYLFMVRVYDPSDTVPKVPVRLVTYGYYS